MGPHTAIPWIHGGGLFVTSSGRPERFIRAGDGSGIVAYVEGPKDLAVANAQLIVRAVNSHDELLSALRDLLAAERVLDAVRERAHAVIRRAAPHPVTP
jgi:hypothetical protein